MRFVHTMRKGNERGGTTLLLPMIHIPKQPIPQIISLNGQIIGDTTQEIVCPVSPSGAIYLTAQPLSEGYLPKAVKLQLMQGQPIEAPLGGQCFLQGETIHIHWQLASIGAEAIHKYPHLLASQSFFLDGIAYEATLSEERETYLAIGAQDTGELSFIYQVEDLAQAEIQIVSVFSQADLFIQGQGAKGPRFLFCAYQQGRYCVLLDEYARAELDGKSLTVYQALLDALGHERRTTYQYQNDSWQRQSEEILPVPLAERVLLPPDKMAEAFAQAVLYRNQEEMRWCLVPEWASELSLDEAAAFLGPFDFVYETQVRKEEQIVLLLAAKLFEDAFVLHDFRCTFEQGRMANIETD